MVSYVNGKPICRTSDLSFKRTYNPIKSHSTHHCYLPLFKLLGKYIINPGSRDVWPRIDIVFKNKSGKPYSYPIGHMNPEDGFLYLFGYLMVDDVEWLDECDICFQDSGDKNLNLYRYHKMHHNKF